MWFICCSCTRILYPHNIVPKLHVICCRGIIIGARVTEYLLEKSRIVTQAPDERNYHVFYELLAGLTEEEKLKYGLLSADKYFYLNQVCTYALEVYSNKFLVNLYRYKDFILVYNLLIEPEKLTF